MTADEKIKFLSQKLIELDSITEEITAVFPEKSFNLDGILVGNIVEVMVAHAYGIELYKQSEKTHDGEVIADGRKVQIKGTQKADSIIIREKPDYLIVEFLDKKNGIIEEIYNGPGSMIWDNVSYVPSMNHYTIRVVKLMEIDEQINASERIPQIVSVQKYKKNIINQKPLSENKENNKHIINKASKGKTLLEGYVNRNNQENTGCLNKPGNHYNQMAYGLRCRICGYTYEANGCDVAIRKCPKCM